MTSWLSENDDLSVTMSQGLEHIQCSKTYNHTIMSVQVLTDEDCRYHHQTISHRL